MIWQDDDKGRSFWDVLGRDLSPECPQMLWPIIHWAVLTTSFLSSLPVLASSATFLGQTPHKGEERLKE